MTPAVHAIGTQGVLSGKVVDKDTMKGLDRVFVTAKSSSDTYTSTTDANGYFSIAGVPAGYYDVSLERVGYQVATFNYILVSGDASTNLQLPLLSEAIEVKGVTVTAARAPITNPRQTMTNYGYSSDEVKKVFPGPQNLGATAFGGDQGLGAVYNTLPGVSLGFDAYYGAASPHIRGGTGSDIGYAFDGVPTYESITNTFGTNLTFVGTGRTDFYVGGYPAPYGNFLSGFVNQVVKRGSGSMHANIEYQTGFWADTGSRLPSYDTATGTIPSYNGQGAYSPTNINIEIQGKEKRFSYYFNHIIQDQGFVSYPSGVDIKPALFEYNGLASSEQKRDTVMNFNYDLDNYNSLQFLYYTGIQRTNFANFQELPCNPSINGSSCSATNTGTGFSETYNANNIAVAPDSTVLGSFDLEKFEWSHRFQSPGTILNLRAWRYNPNTVFTQFPFPTGARWQFRRSAANGILAEYQNQLTPKHLLDTGLSWQYSNNFLISDKNDIGAPTSGPGYFSAATGFTYPSSASSGGFFHLHTMAVPDTATWGAWLTDEWRPTPKWDISAGLRMDRQVYMIVPGVNGNPFADPAAGYVTGTPLDPGLSHPGFISPRFGASYKLSDKLTMKGSYGKFVTFAPARRVERVTGFLDSNGQAYTQGLTNFIGSGFVAPTGTTITPFGAACPDTLGCYRFPGGVAETLSGNRPQIGETIDLSWEYQLDDNTYAKLTPYVKHIKDPLESFTVNGITTFVNSGTIESKGIELYLKKRVSDNVSGWLSYTYSSTRGSQLPFQTDLESGAPYFCSPAVGCSAAGPFSAAQVAADSNQMVPTPYDQRHVLSVNLNIKSGKWEFSPNFIYGSGYPYGLGLHNLQALAMLQDPLSTLWPGGTHTMAQSIALVSGFNPLNESSYNGLRQPGWILGNLAVTYHVNPNVDAIFSVFNLFNSSQILNVDGSVTGGLGYAELTNPNMANSVALGQPCCYASNDASQNISPQYNPMKGQYAPLGFPALRSFYLTLNYKM